jgi:ferrous iron transport protein B
MTAARICLVGNPNCGKTTLFNALTGARQRVGNWPGVTVERKSGIFPHAGTDIEVIDLPGVYSLGATSSSSIDEKVARDYILSGDADLVINIVDASNLERNLYLTSQLIEMRVPMLVALNMMDVARDRQIAIDVDGLAATLGCPVVPLVANRGDGVAHLKGQLIGALASRSLPSAHIPYAPMVERAVNNLSEMLGETARSRGVDIRWLAVKLLEDDDGARRLVGARVLDRVGCLQREIAEQDGEDVDILIADSRFGFANLAIQAAVRRTGTVQRTLSDRIDRIVMNRLLGIPIFLVVIYALFMFTINFGSAFTDVFDGVVSTLLVDGAGRGLAALGAPQWLIAILADGLGGGIATVATFIPIIGCLYLFLSLLEDSGYMARAAFVMDRLMRAVGLPGKSFIPLIVGFGCNVPAIMATRTLENRRDRILTVMMAPFMSCGARLPVYALFAAAFFPVGGQNVVFALYLIGIAFAVLTGLVLKNTLLQGETSAFLMELPPYHLPTLKGVLLHTWDRLKAFTLRAGQVIVPVVVALNVLGSVGTDGSFGNENTDRSLLAAVGMSLTPILAPMGVDEQNWPAAVGMISGIFAKEAVVGTLDALYGALAEDNRDSPAEPEAFDLWQGLAAAFATIPANLADMVETFADPLGLHIVEIGDSETAALEQEVSFGTFGAMVERFDGQLGAFAYLLAVLLYMPCIAATAAIYRETGAAWAIFASLWTTGLGYGAAVITYQAGRFAAQPGTSALWIAIITTAFLVTVAAMRQYGLRAGVRPASAAAE